MARYPAQIRLQPLPACTHGTHVVGRVTVGKENQPSAPMSPFKGSATDWLLFCFSGCMYRSHAMPQVKSFWILKQHSGLRPAESRRKSNLVKFCCHGCSCDRESIVVPSARGAGSLLHDDSGIQIVQIMQG